MTSGKGVSLDEAAGLLRSRAGGYLNNPFFKTEISCLTCTAPVSGYHLCFQCNRLSGNDSVLADATGYLTYAIDGAQSAYNMYRYKQQNNNSQAWQIVNLILGLGMLWHSNCCARLPGSFPLTHWAVVPSLGGRSGIHPLQALAVSYTGLPLLPLAATRTDSPRSFDEKYYHVYNEVPEDSHILLLEDSWVTGVHAQSAAAALKAAGAARVSTLSVARWINPAFSDNAKWIKTHLTSDYDPRICPWTGGGCP